MNKNLQLAIPVAMFFTLANAAHKKPPNKKPPWPTEPPIPPLYSPYRRGDVNVEVEVPH